MPMVSSTEMSSSERSPPMRIDRYELHDVIASGGMATVHLGRLVGTAGFGRTVAIKRLPPHLAKEPEFAAMLTDEARVAARIGHPNIVPTIDVVAARGELFLVMEYVPGLTLAALARQAERDGERVPLAVGCAILVGVLHGLDAAHEARDENTRPLDVVHRDVSPQNILVGADGVARLLDFGIAKAAGRLHTTRDGQVKGKVGYMAPEQLSARAVDRRTDIYAASVVLWEAIAGERLFDGEDAATIFGKVMQMKVPAPSIKAAGVPAALDAAVLSGLEREPSRRFARAREMAHAIEHAAPLARPSEVAAWVAHIGERELAERAALVLDIEQSGATARRASDDGLRSREPLGGDGVSAPATHAAVIPSPVSSKPRVATMLAAAGAVIAVGAGGILAGTRSAAVAPVHDRSAPTLDVPAPSFDAYPVKETEAPVVSVTPPIATSSTPRRAPPVRPNAASRAPASSHAPKGAACDPPFTIDEQGHKHYKVDCL